MKFFSRKFFPVASTPRAFFLGTVSSVMIIFAFAIFLFANLIAGKFDRSVDLTATKIFSLSDESKNFISNLDEEITITLIAGAGKEHAVIPQISRITASLLNEYAAASPKIKIETRDPMLNPATVHRFAEAAKIDDGISEHSVVIQSRDSIRVIQPHEMVDVDIDMTTQRITGVRAYNIEREITRAIQRVTAGASAIVYYVTGSGEKNLPPEFVDFLEAEGLDMREENLFLREIPDDADILFVPMPTRDWTEEKSKRILNFLQNEGRAFFALDLHPAEMPNLSNVLDYYGLALQKNMILEGDAENIFRGRSYYIIPQISAHEINSQKNFLNLVPFLSAEISVQNVRRTTLEIEPIWTTSKDSFARKIESEAETIARVPDDISGPFNLAYAVTDRIFIDGEAFYTQIVCVNSFEFISPWYNTYIGAGNWQFVLNSFRWLKDQPHGIFVPSRMSPGRSPILFSNRVANFVSVSAIGVFPAIFLAAGFFVWLKRRNL